MLRFETDDAEVIALTRRYLDLLDLHGHPLRLTTSKPIFEEWIGRKVGSIGGGYIWIPRRRTHAILINRVRLRDDRPRAVELVVAEELIHMRDWIDGDRRRHSKHGYDRIADKVAALTGATHEEIRDCLIPIERRPMRWIYACPGCGATIARRRKGVWSCGRCSPKFDKRFVLQLVGEAAPVADAEQ
jgi:predicted SprT family Zn-dependent metalloprotease